MSKRTRSLLEMLFWSASVVITLIAAALTPVAVLSAASTTPHTLTIRSSEGLQLAPKDEKEWYERGWWPLLGAAGALIITNAISVRVVYVQAAKSFNAVLRQRKIELLSTSLNEFYNPLLALIDINGEIFAKTGPKSFPKEEPGLSAAGLVWQGTKRKVLTNNADIEQILRTKSHLIQGPDTLEAYQPLLLHVAMYETFQEIETDLYKQFLFPAGIRDHIAQQRLAVLETYYHASGEQI